MTDLYEMAQTIRANFSVANAAGRGTADGVDEGRTSRSGVPPVFAENNLACGGVAEDVMGGKRDVQEIIKPTNGSARD